MNRLKQKISLSSMLIALALTAIFTVSCDGSTSGQLKSFTFTAEVNPQLTRDAVGVVNNSSNSVQVSVPVGTDLTTLVATYEADAPADLTVTVNGETQINGVTPNDFTNQLTYDVSAAGVSKRFSIAVYESTVWQGGFTIRNQADLDEIEGYTSITGVLFIQDTQLKNVDQLTSLTSVGNFLAVLGNSELENLDGLRNLTTINGFLSLAGNPKLLDLNGLSDLRSVENISIANNTALNNVDALSRITNVKYAFNIADTQLTNLDAFQNLRTIGTSLAIRNNPLLTNLSGLSNLESVGDYFYIFENPVLPTSEAEELRDNVDIGGEIRIYDNLD